MLLAFGFLLYSSSSIEIISLFNVIHLFFFFFTSQITLDLHKVQVIVLLVP